MWFRRYGRLVAVCSALAVFCVPAVVKAQQAASNSYSVNEVYFGPGGGATNSTTYSAGQTAGNATVGQTKSTNYAANTGSNTNRAESIAVTSSPSSTNLGLLTVGSAKMATTSFSVEAYLASGYTVTAISNPPNNGGVSSHTLTNLTTPTASSAGTEQFGINLVRNTSPQTIGADPQQAPDSTFSYGVAASGYNTTNVYKYVKDDVIASSPKSSGTTNFTISYLYNISTSTASGLYNFNQNILVTATY